MKKREDAPEEESLRSTRATINPRVALLIATPTHIAPPPMGVGQTPAPGPHSRLRRNFCDRSSQGGGDHAGGLL